MVQTSNICSLKEFGWGNNRKYEPKRMHKQPKDYALGSLMGYNNAKNELTVIMDMRERERERGAKINGAHSGNSMMNSL